MSNPIIQRLARSIRGLSIDAIHSANSGHPGLPLGCADIIACLYTNHLRYHPKHPEWIGRDRFILSAGHGAMLLYSVLHLVGYDVSLDDIKQFRQLHSKTPGHPEYQETPGVEATTGPLGQGIAMGVGIALAQHHQATRYKLSNAMPHTYVLAGDGCLMEGVSAEASSLAGHLKLSGLTVIYDSNSICLDGPTSECFSEDVSMRYRAYGWQVYHVDGHNIDDINAVLAKKSDKPKLIIAKTIIGHGAPTVANTAAAHGKPLATDEIAKTKQFHHIPVSPLFYCDPDVHNYFNHKLTEQDTYKNQWDQAQDEWAVTHPRLDKQYQVSQKNSPNRLNAINQTIHAIKTAVIPNNKATRASSGLVIKAISENLPCFIGGSADLSCSDATAIPDMAIIRAHDHGQRVIKYGVREFAMASISNGLALYDGLVTYMGTFLTFSDYCRNAIRLAALMKLPVIYQFTHDSVFLGEDGPTHQPVEQISSLRVIPNLSVFRPADQTEVRAAWISALRYDSGPTALILSRQALPDLAETSIEKASLGAYCLLTAQSNRPDCVLMATGSEVSLAYEVSQVLLAKGWDSQLVSMPSWDRFEAQSDAYKNTIIPEDAGCYCAIEAGVSVGWHKYTGRDGLIISVDQFGTSAPASDIQTLLGFTVEKIVEKIIKKLK